MNAHGQRVRALVHPARHVEFVHRIRATQFRLRSDLMAVEPQVGTTDDPVGAHQYVSPAGALLQRELRAVPPRNHEVMARDGAQFVIVEHILVFAVFHQTCHHGRVAAHRIPALGRKTCAGDFRAILLRLGTGLDLPMRDCGDLAGLPGDRRGCVGVCRIHGRCGQHCEHGRDTKDLLQEIICHSGRVPEGARSGTGIPNGCRVPAPMKPARTPE